MSVPNDPKDFGTRLRIARTAMHLTQAELGRRLGLSGHFKVSRWESGHDWPPFWDLIALAREVRVEAAWLRGSSEAIFQAQHRGAP